MASTSETAPTGKCDSESTAALLLGARLASLPADVGMLIVKAGATLDYQSAVRWCTVSRAFKKWLDPIIYHTVWIRDCGDANAFKAAIESRNDDAFFLRTVKVLSIDVRCTPRCAYWDSDPLGPVFAVCTGVSRFICRGIIFSAPTAAYITSCTRLRHLHIGAGIPDEALEWFSDRQLPGLTHLSFALFQGTSTRLLEHILTIAPALTHVAGDGPLSIFRRIAGILRRATQLPRVRAVVYQMAHSPGQAPLEDEELNRMLNDCLVKAIHPDYGICMVRSEDYNGHAPRISDSVGRVGQYCLTWGKMLHIPQEIDVWEVADQVTAMKRVRQLEEIVGLGEDILAICGRLTEMRNGLEKLLQCEAWMENNREIFADMQRGLDSFNKMYKRAVTDADKLQERFATTWDVRQ
ncbi:hypothetical protein CYLTODRAFT_423386 [Cylindrobasidium torrendii FP15055 ss-10]|uniref:Uncharacterized protein n=1 Tax=Cylindrobasidium torrendii FP15055 ss-10 TaxID=1314674 RepID=A0A0D7BAC9_9AGAR|nr:hypothetical protein CYLTODRAFT_423386 [Cylindrobasidium torrendii FP15055 ss-10]